MSEAKKIIGKIVRAEVVKNDPLPKQEAQKVLQMSESIERPDVLEARVYKIKPGDHAFYITISDIWLNKGTDHETCRPYEMFINTKDMAAFQWIALASRLISAVMRKGGDLKFILEEMKAVFDPSGGFWMGGRYIPSIVAAIGNVLEQHMEYLGMIQKEKIIPKNAVEVQAPASDSEALGRKQCPKCLEFGVVMQEGCEQCLRCDYSKCG